MIGKTLLLSTAMFALMASMKMKFPSYSLVISQTSSWGEISRARKRNNRNKAQKRK